MQYACLPPSLFKHPPLEFRRLFQTLPNQTSGYTSPITACTPPYRPSPLHSAPISYQDSPVKKPGSGNSLFMLLFGINTPWRIRGPALCKIPQLTRRKGGERGRGMKKRTRRNISTSRFVAKCHSLPVFSVYFSIPNIFPLCIRPLSWNF